MSTYIEKSLYKDLVIKRYFAEGQTLVSIAKELQQKGYKKGVQLVSLTKTLKRFLLPYEKMKNRAPEAVALGVVDEGLEGLTDDDRTALESLEALEAMLYERLKLLEEAQEKNKTPDIKIERTIGELITKIQKIRQSMLEFYMSDELNKVVTKSIKDVNKIVFRILEEFLDEDQLNTFIDRYKLALTDLHKRYDNRYKH